MRHMVLLCCVWNRDNVISGHPNRKVGNKKGRLIMEAIMSFALDATSLSMFLSHFNFIVVARS